MASSRPHPDQRPVPCPSNPILLASQSQWFFTDEELTRTPSQLDGMKFETENQSRSKGVNFITQVGMMLRLPQPTLATAAVYMHRFFMRHSMVDTPRHPGAHPYNIAATSLFLAMKVEETVRRMKEIIISCCRVALKQPNMIVDEQSKDFWRWRDTILHHEDILLEALCFDLQLEQPYRQLYDFMCFFGVQDHKHLRNASWAFLNDSMFTMLAIQFSARTIAAAALYAAARHCDLGFKDDGAGQPWWVQLDVDLGEVRRACMRMAQLYENNAMQRHSQYYPTIPVTAFEEGTEKTRILRPDANPLNEESMGRKRSREPESDSQIDQGHSPAPMNGGQPPKRQRTIEPEPDTQQSSSFTEPSSQYRSTSMNTNGHLALPSQDYKDTQPQPEEGETDPVQQRIDHIVQQNLPSERRHSDDRYRRYSGSRDRSQDRYRDRDRDRDRDRQYPYRGHSPPPPPPPPPEEEKEEGEAEGSEEGEL